VGVAEGEERLVDLLHLGGVLHRSRGLLSPGQGRQQQPDKQRDDGDDHEQLDQRECSGAFHVSVSENGDI
jgi:hypothetical protein